MMCVVMCCVDVLEAFPPLEKMGLTYINVSLFVLFVRTELVALRQAQHERTEVNHSELVEGGSNSSLSSKSLRTVRLLWKYVSQKYNINPLSFTASLSESLS